MRLYEFESKELLQKYNLPVPNDKLIAKESEAPFMPCVVKAQVLFGKRADIGGIIICKEKEEATKAISKLLNSDLKGNRINRVLVEQFVEPKNQYYSSFLFDTDSRSPILLFSSQGGRGIEDIEEIHRLIINEIAGPSEEELRKFLKNVTTNEDLAPLLLSLWEVFVFEDCKLLEINPIAETDQGFFCLDAHIELDDFAKKRHKSRNHEDRINLGRPFTEREKSVKQANDADYQGTVKYLELDGNVAFLAAGGGGSLTCMDALIDAGGKPANYAEFSGDPSEEKMYVLTKQAVSKPGIRGCWIVGAIANFSRIDTMMKGIVRALEEVKPNFPIVVRRAGPQDKEGLAILNTAAEKNSWDVEIYGAETPLTTTAEIIVKKVREHGNSS